MGSKEEWEEKEELGRMGRRQWEVEKKCGEEKGKSRKNVKKKVTRGERKRVKRKQGKKGQNVRKTNEKGKKMRKQTNEE